MNLGHALERPSFAKVPSEAYVFLPEIARSATARDLPAPPPGPPRTKRRPCSPRGPTRRCTKRRTSGPRPPRATAPVLPVLTVACASGTGARRPEPARRVARRRAVPQTTLGCGRPLGPRYLPPASPRPPLPPTPRRHRSPRPHFRPPRASRGRAGHVTQLRARAP